MDLEIFQNLTSSGIYFLVWLVVKFAVRRSMSKWKFKIAENRLRWSVQIRNLMFFALVLGLMLIWASALKTFALSVVVIASAIAVGCKEYIMCFLGGLLKVSSEHFVVGDRIVINDFRGDVINHTPFTTTLFEVGPGKKHNLYTGKKIILPNSVLLTTPVINETYDSNFSFHTFTISVPRTSNWKKLKRNIEQVASQVCSQYEEDTLSTFEHLDCKGGAALRNFSPKVTVCFADVESVEFIVRIPAPVKEKEELEQRIIELVL